jgi:ATP-dependent exoDNAse (exonuclease V) beta subunit
MSSLITQKFKYQSIKRIDKAGKRLYETPQGHAVPSVTTILNATKDKTALIEWRKRVGPKLATEITTEAAGVGTRMHKYLEDYIQSGVWSKAGSNPYAAQAHKMATIIKEKAMVDLDEIWGSEINLWMPQMYAGTSDLIAVYKGQPAICDFKKTNKPKKEEWVDDYYLQLTAYAEAHNAIYDTNICEGHIFMCSRNLEYQQFDISPEDYKKWKHEWYERVYSYYEAVAA